MEGNLLLEQFSRYKKLELEASPFHFLLDANIELNPHQINAFCAAIQALKTGGIVLADEVGLGKTIEAGLVLKYVLESGAKRVLIALPASLRKQWELELEDKFGLESVILDRLTVEKDGSDWRKRLTDNKSVRIVLTSYDYSSKLMKRFPEVKWDFIIIDEAHNLRNVFHGTKRAKNLYELSKGIPKILLTATPLQNSLTDLHGLVSFIDQRIFGSEKVFNKRYIEGQDYSDLKRELSPVLYRTLRKDVAKYMNFKKRTCKTVDFTLSQDEIELYQRVNDFLKRELLYSIPTSNRGLIILVIRKLLASSSFALIETFEILKNRLEKLYEGSKSANAQEGFDLFWSYVEDEIDESGFEETEDEDTIVQKQFIQAELEEVNIIIDVAKRIKTNAKVNALKTAIQIAFDYQQEQGIPQKVVIFTESKRTQKYIAAELRKTGFDDEDILLFNGDFDDTMTKEIYKAWQVKNFGKANYGRSVEYKHAIVDYFRHNAKILICTDAGSEGLNLQFCNMVINYDLPWNPMKIEQRIGRCHRYGQEHDVVAINLLNTQNAADQRVYDILSKKFELFEGVFGASDIALGALESGTSFEKMVLQIYQTCDTTAEFKKAFDNKTASLPASTIDNIRPFLPPELIIQDELHLITGPLGTVYGAYETIIEDMCIHDGIKPKYVVSTATIKNAEAQTRCLYARKNTTQFPPNGFEIGDSFFIREIPVENDPFRKYVGVCAPGQSVKTALLRVYAIILQAAYTYSLQDEYKEVIDPYYSLVGYFNSIRELGGAVRLLQDDIPKRIYRIKNKYGLDKQRYLNHNVEITSRMSSYKIPEKLNQLEITCDSKECLDTAIATNMIAVGMDVDRLGLMVVTGQPKQNSEYIQATSRIGRAFPGLVVTLYNAYRPRDLSHYENFTGYHSQLYRFVEGTTATPFSARARDRVMHALVISAIRLNFPNMANNPDAAAIGSLTKEQLDSVKSLIIDRLNIIKPSARTDAEEEIDRFIDWWKLQAAQTKPLRYYVVGTERYNRLMNPYDQPHDENEKATLRSMREVESSANMFYYTEE